MSFALIVVMAFLIVLVIVVVVVFTNFFSSTIRIRINLLGCSDCSPTLIQNPF